MILQTLSAARDIGRLHDITSILVRWGFGDMVRRMGLSQALEKAGRVLHWKDAQSLAELEPPERVSRAIQDLGPTFIKLGQMLATRVDLFSPEWIAAFEKLQDSAPAVPLSELRAQLREDLGEDPDDVFLELEETALAAASIGQVHRARLKDGTRVILKIRHAEVQETAEADLRLLARLAEIAENNVEELERFKPTEVVRQFSVSFKRELDLANEARNAERVARTFEKNDKVTIPKVYWEWTCERLNVQEYIEGVSGRVLANDAPAGYNPKKIGRIGAEAVLKMVLEDGFFHADPHLGNFIALPNNRLALIDFGMVGRLNETRREQIVDLMYAIVKKDSAGVVEVLLEWVPNKTFDENALSADIDDFLEHYHGRSLKQLQFAPLLTDLTDILREHKLSLPPDLALLFKTFLTLDGVGRRLNPEFNVVEEASPFLEKLVRERFDPSVLLKRGFNNSRDAFGALASMPKDVNLLIKKLRRDGLQVHVDLSRLEDFGNRLDRAASRLTIGIVTAALIIGTAIVTASQEPHQMLGLPTWGVIGFVAAVAMGLWLLFSIWRSRRD